MLHMRGLQKLHILRPRLQLSAGYCTRLAPQKYVSVLRVASPNADDFRHPDQHVCQARRTLASYGGRGKPTRTRVREREQQAQDSQTRDAALSQRLSETQAQQQSHGKDGRTMESLQDAGLRNFMVKVCKTL